MSDSTDWTRDHSPQRSYEHSTSSNDVWPDQHLARSLWQRFLSWLIGDLR